MLISPETGQSAPRYSVRVLFLVAILFVAASPVFWLLTEMRPNEVAAAYENADLYQEVYPAFHYGFDRLRAGELPLWNSRQLCGTPFLANPRSGVFQPLNLLFAALPTEQAMAIHAFLSLALMGIFFVFFMRSLDVEYVPALIGGVAYAFCGASAAADSRPALANAFVWAPLCFWAVREYASNGRFSWASLSGVMIALLCLAGSWALSAAFLLLLVPYSFLVVFLHGDYSDRPAIRRVEGIVLILLIAAAVSAIQWMPTLVWALSLETPARVLWSLEIPGLVPKSMTDLIAQILVPVRDMLPRIGYLGAIAIPSIPAAFFHAKGRRESLFFAAAAVAAGLAAMLLTTLPAFPVNPVVLLFPGLFACAVLVALGFDRLLRTGKDPQRTSVLLPALVVVLCGGILFNLTSAEPRGRIAVFGLLVLPPLLFRIRWVSAVAGMLFAVLLFADLASASRNQYRHPFNDAPACYQTYSTTLRLAEEQALDARILISGLPLDFGLPANLGLLSPAIHVAGGQWPLTEDQAIWWRRLGHSDPSSQGSMHDLTIPIPEAENPRLVDLMAARIMIAAPQSAMYAGAWSGGGAPVLRELKTEDRARLFVNDSALPRTYWVPAWRISEGVAQAADILSGAKFDPTRECVIERDSKNYAQLVEMVPGPRTEEGPPEVVGGVTCRMTEISPEQITIQVTAPQPGITVLADSFDPGWKATLDGQATIVFRANGLFRGVATPAGTHEIVLCYRPTPFRIGAAITIVALALCALGAITTLFRG